MLQIILQNNVLSCLAVSYEWLRDLPVTTFCKFSKMFVGFVYKRHKEMTRHFLGINAHPTLHTERNQVTTYINYYDTI